MLKYSTRAARALGFLKRPFNDVEVYVEDRQGHNMWLYLLRQMVGPDVNLRSVNRLGGRKEVIDACKLDQEQDGRRKLYIIDADLDLLRSKRRTCLKFLYRVRAYCIENVLLNPFATRSVLASCQPDVDENDALQQFDLPTWLALMRKNFLELFVLYAAAVELKPSPPSISFPVMKLCENGPSGPSPSRQKIAARKVSLMRELLRNHPLERILNIRRRIRRVAHKLHVHKIVSGKDYLFPLFYLKLRREFGYRGSVDQLKVDLARVWHPSIETLLGRRLQLL